MPALRSSLAVATRLGAALWMAVGSLPALAIERVELRLPFVDVGFSVKVSELSNPQALLSGTSDLADLDRATNGAIGRQLSQVFQTPLPISKAAFEQSAESPLMDQALLVLSSFGALDGLQTRTLTGPELAAAINRAAAGGQLTILSLLQALPGTTARVDLGRVVYLMNRNVRQRQRSEQLLNTLPAAGADPNLSNPGALAVQRSQVSLSVAHRPAPLQLVLIQPTARANGRLVVISHGLWDGPESFEGWARHLASHGYTVVLPLHPGSDRDQQRAMLSGEAPPPSPAELRLRPLDVSAMLDAAQSGRLAQLAGVKADAVVVIGHSWGAITALQLGGGQASAAQLKRRCPNVNDADRTLSWVLQCNFTSAVNDAALTDDRVKAVAAVSPPISLLFDPQAAAQLQARTLLVAGSRDWVVPPDPEALVPFAATPPLGHRLVLAKGGDHFNLRAPAKQTSAPLSPLLLAWVNGAYAAGSQVGPGPAAPSLLPPQGWGSPEMVLVDVTPAQAAAVR
ncbi:MAG: alpha/beta hydrolase [Synechococcaceae bacterium WB8_1B_136]|nr:alpha/beta hydrolase [Synechococcaceae bacterium WB8_1B_136]